MISIRKSEDRGHADQGWLDSRHTFSFADYYDPQFMGFRSLRVINEDRVAGGTGFDTHPHRDMEIISYVLSGALRHRDSMGHESVIRAGEIQQISAGKGILHSEFNHSSDEPVHFLQIWLLPDTKGVTPKYAERSYAQAEPGRLHLVASKGGRENSIPIHQDADVYLANLRQGDALPFMLRFGRHAWVQVAEGVVTLNRQRLEPGDGAAVSEEATLELLAQAPAKLVVFDLS
jgi:redox-sensitive bicupin YhaK (pirin superfamily)